MFSYNHVNRPKNFLSNQGPDVFDRERGVHEPRIFTCNIVKSIFCCQRLQLIHGMKQIMSPNDQDGSNKTNLKPLSRFCWNRRQSTATKLSLFSRTNSHFDARNTRPSKQKKFRKTHMSKAAGSNKSKMVNSKVNQRDEVQKHLEPQTNTTRK